MPLAEPEPIFHRALLVPTEVLFVCPSCHHGQNADLSEDDYGACAVPAEHRFIQCDNCETNIDIGWHSWQHADPEHAPNG